MSQNAHCTPQRDTVLLVTPFAFSDNTICTTTYTNLLLRYHIYTHKPHVLLVHTAHHPSQNIFFHIRYSPLQPVTNTPMSIYNCRPHHTHAISPHIPNSALTNSRYNKCAYYFTCFMPHCLRTSTCTRENLNGAVHQRARRKSYLRIQTLHPPSSSASASASAIRGRASTFCPCAASESAKSLCRFRHKNRRLCRRGGACPLSACKLGTILRFRGGA